MCDWNDQEDNYRMKRSHFTSASYQAGTPDQHLQQSQDATLQRTATNLDQLTLQDLFKRVETFYIQFLKNYGCAR